MNADDVVEGVGGHLNGLGVAWFDATDFLEPCQVFCNVSNNVPKASSYWGALQIHPKIYITETLLSNRDLPG